MNIIIYIVILLLSINCFAVNEIEMYQYNKTKTLIKVYCNNKVFKLLVFNKDLEKEEVINFFENKCKGSKK